MGVEVKIIRIRIIFFGICIFIFEPPIGNQFSGFENIYFWLYIREFFRRLNLRNDMLINDISIRFDIRIGVGITFWVSGIIEIDLYLFSFGNKYKFFKRRSINS